MSKIQNSKQYNLEERTLEYSRRIIQLCKTLPKNTINLKLIDQLIRSGTSMGANYREANETETKKIFNSVLGFAEKKVKKQFIG